MRWQEHEPKELDDRRDQMHENRGEERPDAVPDREVHTWSAIAIVTITPIQ